MNFIRLSHFSTIFATSSKPTKFHISTIDIGILTGGRVPKGSYKGRRKEGPTHEGKKGRGEEKAYLKGRREGTKREGTGFAFGSMCVCIYLPSVLWRCWLGGRKGIRPVETEWWSAGMVICLERGADLHTAQLLPLPLTVSCFSKIQFGFTFLLPAHPGSPGQRAVKRMYGSGIQCFDAVGWVAGRASGL